MRPLAVLVPARNEARVIVRKLRNLARVDWPSSSAPHHILVIDDGSKDATADLARAQRENFPAGVELHVIVAGGPGGKAAAIRTGIEWLEAKGSQAEVVFLSDADVLVSKGALTAMAQAFAREPGLGVACAAQRFVRDLSDDPDVRSVSGGEPQPAAEVYDRVSAWIRAIESRAGRLFSIHGQLCAWRRGCGLEPPLGMAADDLELGFRARAQGWRVRLVPTALFYEEKIVGDDARAQTERRARAYFQVVRARSWPLGRGLLDRLQWLVYRFGPPAAPYLALALVVGSVLGTAFGASVGAALAMALFWTLAACVPPGRTLVRRFVGIAKAQRTSLELSDRWDTLRSGAGVSEGT